MFRWRWSYTTALFSTAKRIFQEVCSEGGKWPEAAGGPSAASVEVGAEPASNQAVRAALGGWLRRRHACRSAQGLGSTLGCRTRAAARWHGDESIHPLWALCFPFPPRIPTAMLFWGLLSREPSKPRLLGQAASLWANPWRKTAVERPPVETSICSFLCGRLYPHTDLLLNEQINSPFCPLLGASAAS